jgi:hypothetical protein
MPEVSRFETGAGMDGQLALFVPPRPVKLPRPVRWERNTRSHTAIIRRGRHPLGEALGIDLPLRPEGGTCGDCVFRARLVTDDGRAVYLKCLQSPRRARLGPATDIRDKWPACVDYESAAAEVVF